METKKFSRGQIFSLDFIIAMAIVALAIGLLLSFYQTTAAQEKEARVQNELNVIALNASNQLLEKNRCSPAGGFAGQGYKLFGCLDGSKFSSFSTSAGLSKGSLMIPEGFNCYITDMEAFGNIQILSNICPSDTPAGVTDVASVERNFVGHAGDVTKYDYERCVAGLYPLDCAGAFGQKTINVKVWKA
ncbi:MAG TPA: hypothetical protein VFF09_00065 [archaeon]|nr:hypothetical protein [archaeon]